MGVIGGGAIYTPINCILNITFIYCLLPTGYIYDSNYFDTPPLLQ